MNKLYKALLLSLCGILASVGIFSLVFLGVTASLGTQDPAEKPVFSVSALLDGSYMVALEEYFADNFPLHDFFMDANRVLNHFYFFSPSNNMLAIDFHGGAEQGGIALEPSDNSAEEQKPLFQEPDESEVTSVGTIIIHGNRAMDIPTALNESIVAYGETVSEIADALGEDFRVFSLITPNSGQFYSPKSYHTGIHDQKAMIDLCYGSMNENVTTVDAYSALAGRIDEYLFFRTDHHWTQKGAYYAYTAYCEAAGLQATELQQHQTGSYDRFIGSMYNYTYGYPQSNALKNEPDILTYYLPVCNASAEYFDEPTLSYGSTIDVVNQSLDEGIQNKYLCFISGDTPICMIEAENDGGTCLILKDSYGNAFIPFLTANYSRIIAVDPREFSGEGEPVLDLAAFAKEQGVDDVLILNYPFMMCNNSYISNLASLIS